MTVPFAVRRIGHTVVFVSDLDRSRCFYTEVLGFKVSDAYPDAMMPGGMVFLRCNGDHHCLALVGGGSGAPDKSLHHIAFELATLDEVFRARDHLKAAGARIVYEGRRRAGCQIAVEFLDPDGHHLELYWGLDQIGSDDRSRPSSEWRQTGTLEEAVRHAPPGQDTTVHDAALRARVEAGTDRP
ncbi:Glyoxalase/Bleomycin resistance protein/Dioxygenase superfamily protein [Enhydrobacter aerosaccus]|uniref:Glyoxalase/Bleomycin resistance protein/Dioxygenase superfamily protein n=1 Tax=Enhydrobacter aerosaccus TaxID=225324 RepID=A0A1T4RAV9_9HYPH|nr:VOC family protein [Enhydrobacter aerosaccus]SKA12956.1 Glyoxalase/Bleomycin resistance protein/Dioxygenase superfamily protein [Enhydrobacter aerosaccus]